MRWTETRAQTNENENVHTPALPYCQKLSCWCHTNVAYHDQVTRYTASGAEIAQTYRFLELDMRRWSAWYAGFAMCAIQGLASQKHAPPFWQQTLVIRPKTHVPDRNELAPRVLRSGTQQVVSPREGETDNTGEAYHMQQKMTTVSRQSAHRPWHASAPHTPRPLWVCADCQRADASLRLYRMNGKHYCADCLHSWCLSLPVVQVDLLAHSLREQED